MILLASWNPEVPGVVFGWVQDHDGFGSNPKEDCYFCEPHQRFIQKPTPEILLDLSIHFPSW